jgi:uncharacterized lipoprotein YddW (UPF0748 family)
MISRILCLGLFMLAGDFLQVARGVEPREFPREFRGAWVATVENIDWPSRTGLTSEVLRQEFLAILESAQSLNLNAIVLQVRPCADAIYPSELEPWSEYLTGEMGKAPSDHLDPLAFAIDQAHQRGLELHAWLNPFRAHHAASTRPLHPTHVALRRPELVRSYGKYLWLDPGEPEATQHTLHVIQDLLNRYDIDGVHFDDYFYPYPIPDVPFPDDVVWKRAVEGGFTGSREDWRRENVNRFIQDVRKLIQTVKPHVRFGVSPFGIWRPGNPAPIQGFDPYTQLYADSRKWLQEGWVDYFGPQLYWSTSAPHQGYGDLLRWWHDQNTMQRHIWPGNFTSRLLDASERGWKSSELEQQIALTRELAGGKSTGNIHFSMKALQRNGDAFADRLKATYYAQPALVPPTPWLASDPPPKFALSVERGAGDRPARCQMQALDGKPPWLWGIIVGNANEHIYRIEPGARDAFFVENSSGEPWEWVQVQAVNRLGIGGEVVVKSL